MPEQFMEQLALFHLYNLRNMEINYLMAIKRFRGWPKSNYLFINSTQIKQILTDFHRF